MKYMAIICLTTFLMCGSGLAQDQPEKTPAPKEEKDRVSYSIGFQIGGDLKKQGMDVDMESLLKGIEEGLASSEPRLSPEEMEKILVELKKKIVAQKKANLVEREKEQLKMKEKYRGEGRGFLTENAKKEGVVTLPSGLQYRVIREGTGKTPGPNDLVKVNYRGTLIDGTEFDSSYRENKPAEVRVDGVIKGWSEALQLMKEGAEWQLFIPADLAYGERGPLADKSVIFDIELVSVEPSK